MARRRRRQRHGGKLVLAAVVFAAVFFLFSRGPERDQDVREIERELRDWASARSLTEREDRARRIRVGGWPDRSVIVERAYWFGPATSRRDLAADLGEMASSFGLDLKQERAPAGGAAVSMRGRDGREAVRVTLWRGAYAAIVMDDLGYQMKVARRALALPCRMTFAIIPFTPHARTLARMATARGKEVYIHMPMESVMPLPAVPEFRLAISPGMSRGEIRNSVEVCLEQIPNAVGLNNHEGSLATQDWSLMSRLMSVLNGHDLVFMDSATSGRSVAWRAAARAGVRWQKRDVFLDHVQTKTAIRSYFRKFTARAFRDGRAIAVCHPRSGTLAVLEREIPRAIRQGVFFVHASQLASRSGLQ